jgi:hypothetical protein
MISGGDNVRLSHEEEPEAFEEAWLRI